MEYLVSILLVASFAAWWLISPAKASAGTSKYRLPPGPKPLPFIGNALIMPRKQEWKVFQAWAKKYGNLFSLHVFGRTIIIINDFDIAIDLTEKRGAIYSSRPRLIMAGKLMGFNATYPLMPYNQELRESRKLAHRFLSPRPVKELLHVCEEEAGRWLRRLLDTPAAWEQHVKELNGAVTTKVIYGYQSGGDVDPMVHAFEHALHAFSKAIAPGAHMVDFFPSLQYVPSWLFRGSFRDLAEHGRNALHYSVNAGFTFVKHQMATGKAVPSLVRDTIERANELRESDPEGADELENLAKFTAGATAGAGAHTPVSALMFWVLAMVAYPDVQRKAQEELDAVVGRGRFPTLQDRDSLPYINAIIKEVLRWQPVTPVGVPHTCTDDDVYEGMFIPKGTTLIPNQWAMLHNPKYFPDPEEFKPERYLGENPADRERAGNPYAIAFGFGRRICPGLHLGDAMLFCNITKTLAVFDLLKPIDPATGKIYDPPVDCTTGNVSFPVKFNCRFVPRDQQAIDLIHSDTEEMLPPDGMPKGYEVAPEH